MSSWVATARVGGCTMVLELHLPSPSAALPISCICELSVLPSSEIAARSYEARVQEQQALLAELGARVTSLRQARAALHAPPELVVLAQLFAVSLACLPTLCSQTLLIRVPRARVVTPTGARQASNRLGGRGAAAFQGARAAGEAGTAEHTAGRAAGAAVDSAGS